MTPKTQYPDICQMNSTHIYSWTFDNFKRYVEYEAMFFQTCKRQEETHGADAAYRLTKQTPGYSGFLTDTTYIIYLHNCDGPVPGIGVEGTLPRT